MIKFILRFLGLVPYDRLEMSVSEIVSEFELKKNEIRRISLDEMDKLTPTKDGEKIQKLLLQMNRDIAILYEKELVLRELLTKVK
jgi:tetrahydromethanopterin S-methyltransferase subunit G